MKMFYAFVMMTLMFVVVSGAYSGDEGRYVPNRYDTDVNSGRYISNRHGNDDNSGRYDPNKYGNGDNSGRYIGRKYGDDGRYKRPKDEGKYVHIPYPYDGGYGPYSGDWERYKHQGDGKWDGNLDGAASEPKTVSVKPTTTTTPYPTIKYINNGNKIIRQNQALKEDGFKYLYETENKILAEEKAIVKNPNTPDEGIATSGFYQYVGPDGVLYRVTFTADENGFIPKMTRVKYPESLDDGFTKLNSNTIRKKK